MKVIPDCLSKMERVEATLSKRHNLSKLAIICAVAIALIASLPCKGEDIKMAWKNDLKRQPVESRARIEARYIDARRVGFDIDAEKYRLMFDLRADSGQKVHKFTVSGPSGMADLLNGDGIFLQVTDSTGTVYTSLRTKSASRVNIYRRGPYYIETHWLDVSLTNSKGETAPIKGEVVFYSYPEKTHVGVILHVTGAMEVKTASIRLDFDAETCASPTENDSNDTVCANDFCLIRRANNEPTCALIYPVPHGIDDVTIEKSEQGLRISNFIYNSEAHDGVTAKWSDGDQPSAYFEILPLENSEVSEEMEAELVPLLSSAISADSGKSLGYDPIRGCYKLQSDFEGNFSYYFYKAPNQYEPVAFSIHNSEAPRKIYVLHESRRPEGTVECGVLLDGSGDTLPITVQISKNFAGENEEPFYNPGDPPFSETIFPLYLEAGEERKLTSLHLHQNWGNHMLKQFSSLGAWMDYYHMSTGVTETTCYVPFMFAGLEGVTIADIRPMSQKMWKSQPQHDNIAGHSFLRYRDPNGRWHYIEYTGTTFRSTGPNWADMSMSYLSDDGKAKVTIDVFELPQTDELRNFVHLRIDFLDNIALKDNDISENMYLLKISSWVQEMRYTQVAYGGPTGDATVTPIRLNNNFTINAAPLPKENGWATVYPDKKGANAYIVRRFEGKLGGESVSPGVSLIGKPNGDTDLLLVPITKVKEINAGDYLDIDLALMPYGGGTQDWKPAQKCAIDYGVNAPKITKVAAGTKLSDFPTRLALNDKGRAEFSITGGFDCIPIIIEGAKDYSSLHLYNIDGERTLIDLSQKDQKDGCQVFAKDNGEFGFVFLVNTDGKEHKYVVE